MFGLQRFPKIQKGHPLVWMVLTIVLLALTVGVYEGTLHLSTLQASEVTAREIPEALLVSFLRMLASYILALLFSFTVGTLAAVSKSAEKVIIPLIDILQSVPIVGFFPAAMSFFIGIMNGERIGIEFAACFLIFTSQAWNMAFAVYESISSIPNEQIDAAESFGIKGSQKLLKIYIPFCIPRLVYNSILSWTNGWFFLVACEIIAVGPAKFHLPGIGSFLALAAEQGEIALVLKGLAWLTLFVVLLDFLVWRPLSQWSNRFNTVEIAHEKETLVHRIIHFLDEKFDFKHIVKSFFTLFLSPFRFLVTQVLLPIFVDGPIFLYERYFQSEMDDPRSKGSKTLKISFYTFGLFIIFFAGTYLAQWLLNPLPKIAKEIPVAILASTARLIIALLISLAWIVPTVLYLWNKPRARTWFMTIAQIGASLPAIALFPLFILVLVQKFGGGMEFASILLLLTGMQWYLLFNCLGGAAGIRTEISDTVRSFGLSTHLKWKRLVLPSMAPALVTGAITGWGGGWNALVVAEYLVYQDQVMRVTGIGSLLNYSVYELGDNRAITLCIFSMVAWILLLNLLIWRPTYRWAIEKFKGD